MLEKINKELNIEEFSTQSKTPNDKLAVFFDKLSAGINDNTLVKLLLSNRKDKKSELKKIAVTIVLLKEKYYLSFVYKYADKDITKNHEKKEGMELIKKAVENDFFNADLYSSSSTINLMAKQNKKIQLRITNASCESPVNFNHNRIKERLIKTNENVYLEKLGIVDSGWNIRRGMNDKYKQINKYIELLKPYLTDKLLFNGCHIVDMGSGKGYLTFALYDYITNTLKKDINMTGIEIRAELVSQCNDIAVESKFNKLKFVQGNIEETSINSMDILIALHACDTATDDAIYRGIKSNSSLIVCVPCCHKQIRKELCPPGVLGNVVKHGILKERQAEIITDSLRAMLLEAFGYRTNVFEFISTEHTQKNVMIAGEKTADNNFDRTEVLNSISAIKDIFGIKKHYLETLLEKR
jgi:SAM-dependent methyltransferase